MGSELYTDGPSYEGAAWSSLDSGEEPGTEGSREGDVAAGRPGTWRLSGALNQGPADHSCGGPVLLLVLGIKFYWLTAMPTALRITWAGFIYDGRAE